MTEIDPHLKSLYERAYLYAALHAQFAPADAVRWANGGRVPQDIQITARLMAMLRPHCADAPAKAGDADAARQWSMRPAARHYVLSEDKFDADLVRQFDTPIADARLGRGRYAPAALDRLVRLGDTGTQSDIATIAGTLDRAGPDAPGAPQVVALRSLLNRHSAEARTDAILADGFVGREAELERIADTLANPQSEPPLRAIYISGLAGIGKSYLLERAIQMARLDQQPVMVRLDFDRSGLDVQDEQAFYDEISRQVGDSLPRMALALRDLRLGATQADVALSKAALQTDRPAQDLQRGLLSAIAAAINGADKLLLIVLDTLEVLRSEGETRIPLLFERLDRLALAGIDRIAIIAAGRGQAMDPAPDRLLGPPLSLSGLEDHAVADFLRRRDVPEALWPRINRLAGGNPLFLQLAVKAVQEGAFDDTDLPEAATAEGVGGYLYRAILSRVPDTLRGLASEGLILRQVDRAALREVIAPVIAPDLDAAAQARMFDALRDQHWLVSSDPATGTLRHNADMRRAVLPLIYAASPDRTARINARAAQWYDTQDKPFEALYHRLQLTRAGEDMPEIPLELARQFDPFLLEELPPMARDAVRHAQGLRSDFGRMGRAQQAGPEMAAPPVRPRREARAGPVCRFDTARDRLGVADRPGDSRQPDPRAVDDLELLLARNDLREAEFVLQNAFDGWFSPGSRAGQLILSHLWLTGRWSSARRLLDLLPEDLLEICQRDMPLLQGRVMLELWAEFRFDRLLRRLRDPHCHQIAHRTRADSTRIGLDGGALDFALQMTAPQGQMPRGLEAVRGVLALNGTEDWQAAERLQMRAEATRHARGLRLNPGRAMEPAAQASRDVANLNPYAGRLQAFLLREPRGSLATFLRGADTLPLTAARHYAPRIDNAAEALPRRHLNPEDLARSFDALGLSAEWAEGFVLFNPVADLPLLADSVERWRRAAAGDWAFGRSRPASWQGKGADRVTQDRAARIMAAPHPEKEARAQLVFWSGPTHSPDTAMTHLRKRFEARYRATLDTLSNRPPGHDPLQAALDQLHGAGVTAIAAAPLAVLAARDVPPHEVFTTSL
jgi:hypothetical protein